MIYNAKMLRSPAIFLSEAVCNQIAERHEKVRGKQAAREQSK